jgi:hypothetical protein
VINKRSHFARLQTITHGYAEGCAGCSRASVAQAPLLRQLRWLRVRATNATTLLESPHLAELELLEWHWAENIAIVARFEKLRCLVIEHPQLGSKPNALGEALAALRSPLRVLVVAGTVPINVIARNTSFAIQVLSLERSTLLGAECIGGLATLTKLYARGSTFDDTAAGGLAQCSALELADLSETHITDEGGRALATGMLTRLQTLDLTGTAVRDLDVIEQLSQLPAMTNLRLPFRPRVELWLADRALNGVELPSKNELAGWHPHPTHESHEWSRELSYEATVEEVISRASAAGRWPTPPQNVSRRFVHSVDVVCETCHGSGSDPAGPCPWHSHTELVRYTGDVPYAGQHARSFASAADAVIAAERLALELMRAFDRGIGRGSVVWRFDTDDYHWIAPEPSPFDVDTIRRERLGGTVLWPIERRFELPEHAGYQAAVAILEAGFSIPHVAPGEVHLAFHIERRW